jgi:hypothetical protein
MRNSKVTYLLVLVLLMSVLSACHATADGPLPRSMKGYELYSWQEQDQWHFTLITGTNRNKTLEEIVSGENIVATSEWVRIHAAGVEEIKAVLGRIHENEFVFWADGKFVTSSQQTDISLVLPPEEIVNEIKDYAKQCGLDFLVTVPY